MYKKLTSFENLYFAYKDCLKRKRSTRSAKEIEPVYEKILWKIKRELENKTWRPGLYRAFVVTEPTLREIFAADFQDRIVHHALCRIISPILEPTFISQSFACRKKKGTHSAVKNLQKYLIECSKNGRQVYFLKADVKSFFATMNKEVLIKIIENKIKNNDIIWLIKRIILSNPAKGAIKRGDLSLFDKIPKEKSLFYGSEKKGLPIGNLTSQLFANVYLNELDHFVKHILKMKFYIRYVDDFILLDKNKKRLKNLENKIDFFLKTNLDLKLNLNKSTLLPISKGIDFLGYFIKSNYVLARQRVVTKLKDRLLKYHTSCGVRHIDGDRFKTILATINSYYGHFVHAFTFNLRKDIYEKGLGGGA